MIRHANTVVAASEPPKDGRAVTSKEGDGGDKDDGGGDDGDGDGDDDDNVARYFYPWDGDAGKMADHAHRPPPRYRIALAKSPSPVTEDGYYYEIIEDLQKKKSSAPAGEGNVVAAAAAAPPQKNRPAGSADEKAGGASATAGTPDGKSPAGDGGGQRRASPQRSPSSESAADESPRYIIRSIPNGQKPRIRIPKPGYRAYAEEVLASRTKRRSSEGGSSPGGTPPYGEASALSPNEQSRSASLPAGAEGSGAAGGGRSGSPRGAPSPEEMSARAPFGEGSGTSVNQKVPGDQPQVLSYPPHRTPSPEDRATTTASHEVSSSPVDRKVRFATTTANSENRQLAEKEEEQVVSKPAKPVLKRRPTGDLSPGHSPSSSTRSASPRDHSPIPEEQEVSAAAMRPDNDKGDGEGRVDEDEWAAFERDIALVSAAVDDDHYNGDGQPAATVPSALAAPAVVSAPALSAAESAEDAHRQQQQQQQQRATWQLSEEERAADEAEFAAQVLQDEYEISRRLGERILRMRQRREALSRSARDVAAAADDDDGDTSAPAKAEAIGRDVTTAVTDSTTATTATTATTTTSTAAAPTAAAAGVIFVDRTRHNSARNAPASPSPPASPSLSGADWDDDPYALGDRPKTRISDAVRAAAAAAGIGAVNQKANEAAEDDDDDDDDDETGFDRWEMY